MADWSLFNYWLAEYQQGGTTASKISHENKISVRILFLIIKVLHKKRQWCNTLVQFTAVKSGSLARCIYFHRVAGGEWDGLGKWHGTMEVLGVNELSLCIDLPFQDMNKDLLLFWHEQRVTFPGYQQRITYDTTWTESYFSRIWTKSYFCCDMNNELLLPWFEQRVTFPGYLQWITSYNMKRELLFQDMNKELLLPWLEQRVTFPGY